jgi:hypothetical protein
MSRFYAKCCKGLLGGQNPGVIRGASRQPLPMHGFHVGRSYFDLTLLLPGSTRGIATEMATPTPWPHRTSPKAGHRQPRLRGMAATPDPPTPSEVRRSAAQGARNEKAVPSLPFQMFALHTLLRLWRLLQWQHLAQLVLVSGCQWIGWW